MGLSLSLFLQNNERKVALAESGREHDNTKLRKFEEISDREQRNLKDISMTEMEANKDRSDAELLEAKNSNHTKRVLGEGGFL